MTIEISGSATFYYFLFREITDEQLAELRAHGLDLNGLFLCDFDDSPFQGFDEMEMELDNSDTGNSKAILLKPKKKGAEVHDFRGKHVIVGTSTDKHYSWNASVETHSMSAKDFSYSSQRILLSGGESYALMNNVELSTGDELDFDGGSGGWNEFELIQADGRRFSLEAEELEDQGLTRLVIMGGTPTSDEAEGNFDDSKLVAEEPADESLKVLKGHTEGNPPILRGFDR